MKPRAIEALHPSGEVSCSEGEIGRVVIELVQELPPALVEEAVGALEAIPPAGLPGARDTLVRFLRTRMAAATSIEVGSGMDITLRPSGEKRRVVSRPIDMLLGGRIAEYITCIYRFDDEQKDALAAILAKSFGRTHENTKSELAERRVRAVLDEGAAYAKIARSEGVDHTTVRTMIQHIQQNVIQQLTDEEWQHLIQMIERREFGVAREFIDAIDLRSRINESVSTPSRQTHAWRDRGRESGYVWRPAVNLPPITSADIKEREALITAAQR